ncbi:MAG: hypothetical protein ABFS56_33910, partial [Pseudomonadota bacterium]
YTTWQGGFVQRIANVMSGRISAVRGTHPTLWGDAQIGKPDTATMTIKDDDKKPYNCKKAIGIPKKECQALVALYDSTDGDNWTNNTG